MIIRRWNRTLVDCYRRGCVCKGCPIYETYKFDCKCKQSVIEAVKQLGIPEKEKMTY